MKASEIFARAVELISSKAKPVRSDVERALQDCEARGSAAVAELERLASTRETLLVGGSDADLEKHGAAVTAATNERDRAAAIATRLRERLVTIVAEDAAAACAERRSEVEMQAELAVEALRTRYPKAVAEVRSILRTLGVSQVAIADFARAYPGEPPIADPERVARAPTPAPDQIVSERNEWQWIFTATGAVIPPGSSRNIVLRQTQEERDQIYRERVQESRGHHTDRMMRPSLEVTPKILAEVKAGRGAYEFELASTRTPVRYVELIRREVRRFEQSAPRDPLAASIKLPGLLPTDVGWVPPGHTTPDAIVAAIDAAPPAPRTSTVVDYRPA